MFKKVFSVPSGADLALALLCLAAASLEVWVFGASGPSAGKLAASILTTVPLAWRSVAPVAVAAVTSGGFAASALLGLGVTDLAVPMLSPLIAIYALATQRWRRIGVGSALAMLAYGAVALSAGDRWALAAAKATVLVAGPLGVGRAVHVLGFETSVLEERALRVERERDSAAQAAVARERARIARELHDVIGHSVSVMGVQAGAVRRRLAPEQEREREVLLSVERAGREAVHEMRRLLGIMRSTDGDRNGEADLSPVPTVQRFHDLIADMRGAGIEVDLRVDGSLDELSPGRRLAAFRIVQEALTNVLRHSPGARARVVLRRTPCDLEIEVNDDGATAGPDWADRGGHGLVGMRERVALYGGTLSAGPATPHGFAVRARLPLGS